MGYLKSIPLSLVFLRLFLTIPVLIFAFRGVDERWLALCLFIGLISDIFDGIIARKLHVATTTLRRADTIVDTIFFSTIVLAAWYTHPTIFFDYRFGIGLIIGIRVVRIIFDFLKFRREAAYHMWSTKLWGITVFLALTVLWLELDSTLFFQIAVLIGIFTNLEGLAASLILPTWQHDLPTLYHAYKRRQTQSI